MPLNRFPDSQSKRELRRRDARSIRAFRSSQRIELGLMYCGMPSVEFLDVAAWHETLRSVCAVEMEDNVLSDMRIEWDRRSLDLPIHFVHGNFLEFLLNTDDVYDLYNLDFYGGFLYLAAGGNSRCVDAVRSLIHRHSQRNHSFVLIATFNVRDTGAKEYSKFIDNVPMALLGWDGIKESCEAHQRSQATRLKLCFPFLCWQVGMSDGFAVHFDIPTAYSSVTTRSDGKRTTHQLIHFYAEFVKQPGALPDLTQAESLAEIINYPLRRLDGMIPRIELFPQVERPVS